MYKAFCTGLLVLLSAAAHAQLPLTPDQAQALDARFSQASQHNGLSCELQLLKPFLDFAFSFEGGYILRCPLRQFEGKASSLLTFTRITPESGAATTLADRFEIPSLPPVLRHEITWKHFSDEAELSGVFALGEGKYRVDLLVLDDQMRGYRKSWNTEAFAHGREKHAAMAMPPNSAASAMIWPTQSNPNLAGNRSRLRLTVLLDAAPIQPYALRLRAWDRAFLLQSLASLLRDTSSVSVRLIAFNLDQRQEIFRQNDFGHSDLPNLATALRRLELGTVSYHTLQDQQGWSALLAKLVNDEQAADQLSNAVIFLGPRIRVEQKVPREMLKLGRTTPRLFYFEYFPTFGHDFPDTIHYLTTACKGTVLKMHTPSELADGIQKMQRKLKQGAEVEAGT